MNTKVVALGRRLPSATLVWVTLVLMLGVPGTSFSAKDGNGGGGKPPTDEEPPPPPPVDPVFVYEVPQEYGAAIYVADLADDGNGLGNRAFLTTGGSPTWSPDGKQILFVANDGRLMRMPLFDNIDNKDVFSPGDPITLRDEFVVGTPVWSSRGWIAYLPLDENVGRTFLTFTDVDGSNAYATPIEVWELALSPNNTKIAITASDVIGIRTVTKNNDGSFDLQPLNDFWREDMTDFLTWMDIRPGDPGISFHLKWSNKIDDNYQEGRLVISNEVNACADFGQYCLGFGVWLLDPTDPPDDFSDINWIAKTRSTWDGVLGARAPSWSPDDTKILYDYSYWARDLPDPCTGKTSKGRNTITNSVVEVPVDVEEPVTDPTCDQIFVTDGEGSASQWWPGPVCGNGITDRHEQCDDGNTTDGDGCSAICTSEP